MTKTLQETENRVRELLETGADLGWNEAITKLHIFVDHFDKTGQHDKAETIREVLHNIGKDRK